MVTALPRNGEKPEPLSPAAARHGSLGLGRPYRYRYVRFLPPLLSLLLLRSVSLAQRWRRMAFRRGGLDASGWYHPAPAQITACSACNSCPTSPHSLRGMGCPKKFPQKRRFGATASSEGFSIFPFLRQEPRCILVAAFPESPPPDPPTHNTSHSDRSPPLLVPSYS
ncbi:hypothetical protein FN846DRAFT_458246 [Sphaerosporella brunnea]|uniref:Uncharacterized protein n=1 Tax=Sphaerosporella brunnea TaxID=1250544 RepID=A0A5J5EEZ2_9PEZI|nr:hypothetical protein FN846DRAFT_458246 [Sphaerosporella brunnea]